VPDLGPLLPAAHELRGLHCHLCGPAGLLDAAVRLLRERGVAASRIHFERFDFR
jgi:ferredoxin-NADP reductase